MDGWMDGYFSPHCLAAPSDGVKLPGTRAKDHNDGTMDSFFNELVHRHIPYRDPLIIVCEHMAQDMLQSVWKKMNYCCDVYRVTMGALIKQL
jgi:hypothetical protein